MIADVLAECKEKMAKAVDVVHDVLEDELLALGHAGAEYDAWLINIGKGDQFSPL